MPPCGQSEIDFTQHYSFTSTVQPTFPAVKSVSVSFYMKCEVPSHHFLFQEKQILQKAHGQRELAFSSTNGVTQEAKRCVDMWLKMPGKLKI